MYILLPGALATTSSDLLGDIPVLVVVVRLVVE